MPPSHVLFGAVFGLKTGLGVSAVMVLLEAECPKHRQIGHGYDAANLTLNK
jgi:hypothetical protein